MEPLVSVCCITYNQENYIRQALEGFVSQNTTFGFKVIIGDDCSTDGTAGIVSEYAQKYPELIKPIFHKINLGPAGNFSSVLGCAAGKYIALCEGDDYWDDPLKLQKQVDFLERNPEYAICFHPVKVLTADGTLVADFVTRKVPETTDIYELVKGNYMHTPSVVIRNYPDVIKAAVGMKSMVGDYVLYLLAAQKGKIWRLPGVMAVYRHGVGILSSGKNKEIWNEVWPEILRSLCGYFKGKDERVYSTLVEKRDIAAAGSLRFFYGAGGEAGALSYLNSIEAEAKKEILEYLLDSEAVALTIRGSRSWSVLQKFRRLKAWFFPAASR